MGQPIQGPGQTIWGPIQRRFGPSCARRVLFLRKSTDFLDMRTECQIIKTYHSFITVIIIYHKPLEIARSLAPRSILDCSPIGPRYDESLM